MTTRRDYLIGLGLAKAGKGKFSNAAKDAIAKAEADGTIFSDSSASVPAPKVRVAKPISTEPKVSNSDPGVMLDEDLAHFGVEFFYRKDGKKKPLSNRAACMNCGYSLIAHQCNLPKAITPAGIVVMVEA